MKKQKTVSQELHAVVRTQDEAGNVTEETLLSEPQSSPQNETQSEPVAEAELGGGEKPAEPTAEQCVPTIPPHVEIYNARTAELEKAVAMAAVDFAHKDAERKRVKKAFETLTAELSEHLTQTPQLGLLDNLKEGVCRKCQIHEGEFDKFATADLCQRCADKLGKEVGEGKTPDALSKQAQEALEACPECSGKGMVGGTECVNCEGTGQLPTLPDVPEDEPPADVDNDMPPEDEVKW